MAQKPETRFKKRVKSALEKLPNTWILITQETSRRGVHDIIMCCNGHFISLELKVADNDLDPLQRYTANKITAAGGLALPVYPESWLRILGILKRVASGKVTYRPEMPPDLTKLI